MTDAATILFSLSFPPHLHSRQEMLHVANLYVHFVNITAPIGCFPTAGPPTWQLPAPPSHHNVWWCHIATFVVCLYPLLSLTVYGRGCHNSRSPTPRTVQYMFNKTTHCIYKEDLCLPLYRSDCKDTQSAACVCVYYSKKTKIYVLAIYEANKYNDFIHFSVIKRFLF